MKWDKPKLLGKKDILLTPRSLKAEQQRDYISFKKERDRPLVAPAMTLDKMGPPPRVVAKAWTQRACVYWLHPAVQLASRPLAGYKVKRYRLDKDVWTCKV